MHKTLYKLSQSSLAASHGLVGLSYDGLSVTGALVTSDQQLDLCPSQWTYAPLLQGHPHAGHTLTPYAQRREVGV